MTYRERWLLAVAMKQPYPNPETGATASYQDAEYKAKQATAIKLGLGAAAVLAGLALITMRK